MRSLTTWWHKLWTANWLDLRVEYSNVETIQSHAPYKVKGRAALSQHFCTKKSWNSNVANPSITGISLPPSRHLWKWLILQKYSVNALDCVYTRLLGWGVGSRAIQINPSINLTLAPHMLRLWLEQNLFALGFCQSKVSSTKPTAWRKI